MGFGSYDESEQGNHDIDTEDIGEDGPRTATAHDGELRFEYGDASSEDLLEAYEEFKSR